MKARLSSSHRSTYDAVRHHPASCDPVWRDVRSMLRSRDPQTNVTNDDLVLTCRIVLAHIDGLLHGHGQPDRVEIEAANEAEASAYASWGE